MPEAAAPVLRCKDHPEALAVARCSSCSRALCSTCFVFTMGERPACARCAYETATRPQRRFSLAASDADQPLRFRDRSTPLGAIYFLRRSDAACEPQIVAASIAESLAMLMNRQYPTSRLAPTRETAAQHFANLSDVVARVPCRHLIVPDALAKLPLVCERLRADLASPAMA